MAAYGQCPETIKNTVHIKDYLQGQAAENIVDVLTVIREGSSGFGETAECSPQHLQLRKRNLPLSCVLLNQLCGKNTEMYNNTETLTILQQNLILQSYNQTLYMFRVRFPQETSQFAAPFAEYITAFCCNLNSHTIINHVNLLQSQLVLYFITYTTGSSGWENVLKLKHIRSITLI